MQKIIYKKEKQEKRLDKLLTERFSDMTRNRIQKYIKSGKIKVNGRVISPHYCLKEEDVIEIDEEGLRNPEIKEAKPSSINTPDPIPDSQFPAPDIIAKTPDYIIINKPAGLAVHGAPHMEGPTMVDWLISKYPEVSKIGLDPERPGIVHRLDKDVSGLMVIARTQSMYDLLVRQFKDRTVDKKYVALVYGRVKAEEDLIEFLLERSTRGFKMAAKPLSQTGKRSQTYFKIKQRLHNYTLLELKIITGRTHQIRAHLLAYGHPIVGDKLYGNRESKIKNKKINLGRIFLVSKELAFTDLDGNLKKYKIELPEKLANILSEVK